MKKCFKFSLPVLFVSALSFGAFCLWTRWDVAFELMSQIPIIGLIVGYDFQPLDYEVPRLDIPLCAETNRVMFSCKYNGRHEIDIVDCHVKPWANSELGLVIDVLDGNDHSVFHAVRSNEVALISFDRTEKQYLRFCYAVAFAPEDLPIDTPLYFSFSSFGNYETFHRSNPNARIVLRKFTDK